ncbi:PucR family transcriptional regulator ligand-binding domain-containing protein [Vibrio sp. RC27]
MLTVRDIPQIEGLNSMVIQTKSENVNRAIRWPYIAEDHNLSPWLKGGEVIFVTGINRQWTDHQFSQLVDTALRCHAPAIVVLTGSIHIPILNKTWCHICEQAGIALIEQPYSLPMVTVTERLSNAIIQDTFSQRSKQWFIQQLIHSSTHVPPIALTQARTLGLDCDVELTVAVLRTELPNDTVNESSVFVMQEFLLRYQSPFPITEIHNGWVLIVPTQSFDQPSYSEKGLEIWHALKHDLSQHQLIVSIGLNDGGTLVDINRVTYQARQCADVANNSNQNGVYHHRSFGLQQLFAAVDDVQLKHDFCARYLGSLYRNQDIDSVTLKTTLRCYFEQLGALRQTASVLNVHRNTVTSRLHRFEAITGLSMTDATHRLGIQNALLIERAMFPTPIDS